MNKQAFTQKDRKNYWPLLTRVTVAVVGGYALANAAGVLLSYVLPMSRSDAVMTALLVSFAIYAAAVMWVFSVRSVHTAWIGIVLPTIVLVIVSMVLRMSGLSA